MSEIKSVVKTNLVGNEVIVELATCLEWIQGEANKFEVVEEKRFSFLGIFPPGTDESVAMILLQDDCFKQVLFYGLKQKAKDGVASVKDDKERFDITCKNFERLLSQDKAVRSFTAEGGRSAGVTKAKTTFLEASFSNVVIKLVADMELFVQLDMEKVKGFFILTNQIAVKDLKAKELTQAVSDKLVDDFVLTDKEILIENCGK